MNDRIARFNAETAKSFYGELVEFRAETAKLIDETDDSVINEFRLSILSNQLPPIEVIDQTLETAKRIGEISARNELIARFGDVFVD